MSDIKKFLSNILFFKEPEKASEQFILKETPKESEQQEEQQKFEEPRKRKNEHLLLNKPTESDNKKKEKKEGTQNRDISKNLSENLDYIKKKFSIPINGDIVLREFNIVVKDRSIPAFIFFYDGMTDRKVIDDDILMPLMLLSNLHIKGDAQNIAEYVRAHLLSHNQIKETGSHQEVIDEVNFGGCGIYIDGIDVAFSADVKGWEHRSVERPNTELVLRGPQEGFNESLRACTALIRRRVKDENLIAENIQIGRRSKTPCSLMYIKNIANDSLVNEVRRRLKYINIDYLNDSGELEQLIEDNSFFAAPQVIASERPDRVASMLEEGKVAIVVSGSPFVLVLPAAFYELFHSTEDIYIRFPYSNLLRIVRLIGMILSLLLPGLYVAITNFHHEMIPTDLLFAIESAREKVPFPSITEILIMEFAFELIREAGIRIPGPIGPTLGIIGALILGQAAVAANIVSPILIIIVAVTGIGSFAIPNFSLSFSFRILRFVYILLGATVGFLGIAAGLFAQGIWFARAKSFGVPFLVPFAPRTSGSLVDIVTKRPIWMQEDRPDFLNTKARKRQPEISREWLYSSAEEDKGDEK